VTYEQWITEVVKVVETVGTGIMVIGGLGAFLAFLRDAATDARRAGRTNAFAAISAAASCSDSKC
jgi:hypothetical protein